jgi:tetratricopeptide (TPR) repeat protein
MTRWTNWPIPLISYWNWFLSVSLPILKKEGIALSIPEIDTYYNSVEAKIPEKEKIIQKKGYYDAEGDYVENEGKLGLFSALVSYRNSFAHGFNPPAEMARESFSYYSPILEKILKGLSFLKDYGFYANREGSAVLLKGTDPKPTGESTQSYDPFRVSIFLKSREGKTTPLSPLFITGQIAIKNATEAQLGKSHHFVYENNSGKRIFYVSPDGLPLETNVTIEYWQKLLASKEKILSPITQENFTLGELNDRIKSHSKLELNELYLQKKLLPGIYLKRRLAEAKIKSFFVSPFPVAFVAARGGAGKSNLLGKFVEETIDTDPLLLLKAGDLEEDSIEETLQKLLGLEKDFFQKTLPESFVLRIFLDGLNERKKADTYFLELIEFVKRHPGHFKLLVSYRQDIGGSLPEIPESIKIHEIFYPGGSESSEKKEGLEKISIELDTLNKLELKELWELYTKDKKNYLPKFTLEDLEKQNRSFLEELKNPLTLKIFCSTFHGKSLPKSITRSTLWKLYLEKLETNRKGSKKLLLEIAKYFQENCSHHADYDSLLSHPILGEEFRKTQIDSVWVGLNKEGILFRKKEESGFSIKISIEPLLDYLTGEVFINAKLDINAIQDLLKGVEYNPINRGISNYLTHCITTKNFKLVADFIDSTEDEGIEIAGEAIAETFLYQETIEGDGKELFDELLKNQTEKVLKVILYVTNFLIDNFKKSISKIILYYFKENYKNKDISYILLLQKISSLDSINYIDKMKFLLDIDLILKKDEFKYTPEKALLFLFVGDFFVQLQEYDKAKRIYIKSLKIMLSIFGKNVDNVAIVYDKIGGTYLSLDNYYKGLKYKIKSLNIRLSIFEEKSNEVASSYISIGKAYMLIEEIEKVLEFLEKSLNLLLSIYGEKRTEVPLVYDYIGLAYQIRGETEKGLEFLNKSLINRITYLGENHPDVAISYLYIAINYRQKGFFDKAEEFYFKSLRLQVLNFGEENEEVANAYYCLGELYFENKDYDKAQEFYEKSLNIRLTIFGEQHTAVASCFQSKGILLATKREFSSALELFDRSLKINLSIHGENHSKIILEYFYLSLAYFKSYKFFKALKYIYKLSGLIIKVDPKLWPDQIKKIEFYKRINK